MKKKQFWLQATLFFVPVIIVYILLEMSILHIPFNYNYTSNYLNENGAKIELASFGSSQMKCAVNPAHVKIPSINFGSTSQHHRLDFEILKQCKDRLPALKTVIFEISYSHLEMPHNSKSFWKNNVYLKYFDVNAFDRKTYFKDKLIFLARPDFYAKQFVNTYIKNKPQPIYNKFGYELKGNIGIFERLDFNEEKINARKNIDINKRESLKTYQFNTDYFNKILAYTQEHNLQLIITTVPMHATFLKQRNPNILKRRDAFLEELKTHHNVHLFLKEEDTVHFTTRDFTNASHLNAQGGKKYSQLLQEYIQNINKSE